MDSFVKTRTLVGSGGIPSPPKVKEEAVSLKFQHWVSWNTWGLGAGLGVFDKRAHIEIRVMFGPINCCLIWRKP